MSQKQALSPKKGVENVAQSAIIPGGGGTDSMGVRASQFASPAKATTSQSTIILGANGEGGAIVPKASNGGILPAAASPTATASATAVGPRRSGRATKSVVLLTYEDNRAGSKAGAAAVAAKANAGGAVGRAVAKANTGGGASTALVTFHGEEFNPSDLAIVKHRDGSMEFPHPALAVIEYACNLAIADESNDFERSKKGAIPLEVLRYLQSKKLLSPHFTSSGRCCDLNRIVVRLRRSCRMEGCYCIRHSDRIGGDGSQCDGCYLDETQGTDRVRRGMLGSVSAKQKVFIHKMISRDKNRMWGLWTELKEAGGDLLADLSYDQIWYCAHWLVDHEWHAKREGDDERGRMSNLAKLGMMKGGKHGSTTAITATASDDGNDDDDDSDGDKKPRASASATGSPAANTEIVLRPSKKVKVAGEIEINKI